jgi:hypothetical protein
MTAGDPKTGDEGSGPFCLAQASKTVEDFLHSAAISLD